MRIVLVTHWCFEFQLSCVYPISKTFPCLMLCQWEGEQKKLGGNTARTGYLNSSNYIPHHKMSCPTYNWEGYPEEVSLGMGRVVWHQMVSICIVHHLFFPLLLLLLLWFTIIIILLLYFQLLHCSYLNLQFWLWFFFLFQWVEVGREGGWATS